MVGVQRERDWLLVDLISGETAVPEKSPRWRPALQLSARHSGESIIIESRCWSLAHSDPNIDEALASHFGFQCGIRRAGTVIETQTGTIEVRPRYSASPLHLLSTSTVADLQMCLPGFDLDVRRFRPNFVLDETVRDADMLGRSFTAGTIAGDVTEATKRCGMTMIAQDGLVEAPEILRAIVRLRARCLGVYATVSEGGTVFEGDDLSFT